MTLPALLFGFLISTLYGAAFHLWRDGGAGRFSLYLLLGWIGFWVGHTLAEQWGWPLFSVGQLNLGLATLASAIFLFIGHWLSLVEAGRRP